MNRLLLCMIIACIAALPVRAGVVVNEAMINEPGSSVTLEWVELFNDSSGSVDLSLYTIITSFGEYSLDSVLPARGYFIACRRLVGPLSAPGFETVWGNNSGIWGDTPAEAGIRVMEVPLALNNISGSIRLNLQGIQVSALSWTISQPDGVSLERTLPAADNALPSVDPSGSTPGLLNSVSPAPNDLAIASISVVPESPGARVTVRVRNAGTSPQGPRALVLYRIHPADSLNSNDTLATLTVNNLVPGDEVSFELQLNLEGIYTRLGAVMGDDERPLNNRAFFEVPGSGFPPVILTEIMPDPEAPLQTEWVELNNISDSAFDLSHWKLGDSATLRSISPEVHTLDPGERVVIARDAFLFRQYYVDYSGSLIEPSMWQALNNAGDVVRLVDSFGFTADQHSYASVYGNNFTIARDETDSARGGWFRSADVGGTPGEPNRVQPLWQSGRISLDIVPRIFSPNGDGFEETTTIAVTAAEASAYALKIYDRQGRLVRILAEGDILPFGTFIWDGLSDAGNRLPIGMYICFFEAEGLESIKQTVVIAR